MDHMDFENNNYYIKLIKGHLKLTSGSNASFSELATAVFASCW